MTNTNRYIPPLFAASTREQARQASSRSAGKRYARIIQVLSSGGPACIFEVAQEIGCFDHQISGRFGELERLGLIRKTGQRRVKPSTGCQAEVYALVVREVNGANIADQPSEQSRAIARDARDWSPSNN